jgi:hypothetical protein
LAYQPPASSIFLSEQTSHQQPASSTFLSEQISTSHQPNEQADWCLETNLHHVRLAYQPSTSSTLLSQQTRHQQPASITLLSEQTSTSHQPPANRTGWMLLFILPEQNSIISCEGHKVNIIGGNQTG